LMAELVSGMLLRAPAVRQLFEARQELCRGSGGHDTSWRYEEPSYEATPLNRPGVLEGTY
jgi:hypothetical protein